VVSKVADSRKRKRKRKRREIKRRRGNQNGRRYVMFNCLISKYIV